MGKKEAKIENYLKESAEKKGFMCLKFVSPSLDGVPDRIIIGHGLVFFVETKAPGGTPRKLQISIMRTMKEHGALVFVADTQQQIDQIFQDIQPYLNQRGNHMKDC